MSERRVYKYEVTTSPHLHKLSEHNRLLKFDKQGGVFHVWIEVDAEAEPTVQFAFWIIGTGHPIPEGFQYVDTCFSDPPYVWHLYYYDSRWGF